MPGPEHSAHGRGVQPGSQSCVRMEQVGQQPWNQWSWEKWLLWPGMRGAKQLILPMQLHWLGSTSTKTAGIFSGKAVCNGLLESSMVKAARIFLLLFSPTVRKSWTRGSYWVLSNTRLDDGMMKVKCSLYFLIKPTSVYVFHWFAATFSLCSSSFHIK